MKSCTDLKQSKKLAEILSPDSADMCHKCIGDESYDIIVRPYSEYYEKYESLIISKDFNAIPCWSLSALFDMLPKFIGDYGKCLYYDVDGYHCGYMDDDGNFMLTIQETKADNSVDACCDMIINLHKLSIL